MGKKGPKFNKPERVSRLIGINVGTNRRVAKLLEKRRKENSKTSKADLVNEGLELLCDIDGIPMEQNLTREENISFEL